MEALERLLALADDCLAGTSAKYTKLLEYLRGIGVGPSGAERAVVFSERVATLEWLLAKLSRDLKLKDDQIKIMHGGLSDVEQQETVENFKQSSSPIRLLVTGDVASEGVNLHSQCHELIHFDIPWSLIRIEQRNGRIDRYGQKKRPQITTMLLSPSNDRFSGDVRVLQRLLNGGDNVVGITPGREGLLDLVLFGACVVLTHEGGDVAERRVCLSLAVEQLRASVQLGQRFD